MKITFFRKGRVMEFSEDLSDGDDDTEELEENYKDDDFET